MLGRGRFITRVEKGGKGRCHVGEGSSGHGQDLYGPHYLLLTILLTNYSLLLTTFYRLLTIYSLLVTSYQLPVTSYYSLLTTHYATLRIAMARFSRDRMAARAWRTNNLAALRSRFETLMSSFCGAGNGDE